jgi:hypothetical protein
VRSSNAASFVAFPCGGGGAIDEVAEREPSAFTGERCVLKQRQPSHDYTHRVKAGLSVVLTLAPMLQPASSGSSGAPRPPEPAPTATETVTRPDPGLARGKWEAPPWAFWVALGLVVLGVGLYVARRMGLLRLKKRAPEDSAPVSRRGPR